MSAHRDGSACARSAGKGFARAAFVDAEVDVRAVQYFHEAHVHALRKTPMTLDGGPESIDWRRIRGLHREHGVRIAHRDRADVHLRAGNLERIDVSFAGCVERQRRRREEFGTPMSTETVVGPSTRAWMRPAGLSIVKVSAP